MKNYKDLIKEFDSNNNYQFDAIKYRQGASITCPFGLAEGYNKDKTGKLIWDTVRIHTGVDRGIHDKNGNKIVNIIFNPFDANVVIQHVYSERHYYGSLLRLFVFDYGFEIRIAHIYPNEFEATFKKKLDKYEFIPKNIVIGQCGDFGDSSGRHTHTEIVSLESTCPVLESILAEQYKDWNKQYSDEEIISFYKTRSAWMKKKPEDMLQHYNDIVKPSRLIYTGHLCNKYKHEFLDIYNNKQVRTRYSSELLFGGM